MPFETTFWSVLLNLRRDSEAVARELVRRYRTPILEYLCSKGLSREDAEDLSQEVLVDLCRPDFLESVDRQKGRFRTLILSLVRHKLASHLRRHYAQKRGGGNPLGDSDVLDLIPLDEPSKDVEFDRLWILNLIREAVERLRGEAPHLAEAFALYYDQGMPYRSIAERCGKTKSDITNHLYEARRRIRKFVRHAIETYVSSYEEFQEEISELLERL